MTPKERKAKERQDNDDFRRAVTHDRLHLTDGIKALGAEALEEILSAVRAFQYHSADSKNMRELGAFTYRGETVEFAILPDIGSIPDDVANPIDYLRILVIRLASED